MNDLVRELNDQDIRDIDNADDIAIICLGKFDRTSDIMLGDLKFVKDLKSRKGLTVNRDKTALVSNTHKRKSHELRDIFSTVGS